MGLRKLRKGKQLAQAGFSEFNQGAILAMLLIEEGKKVMATLVNTLRDNVKLVR